MDPERYGQLLAEWKPAVIDSPEEHDRLMSAAEILMDKGESITAEERKLLELLVLLIKAFENEVAAEEEEEDESGEVPARPHETLGRLLAARGLELSDVESILGNPHAAREVLEGRRRITSGQAKQLGKYFRVPYKLFLE